MDEDMLMSRGSFHRPDPARWVWYAYGGTLAPRYQQWVLYDLTARSRWWRQVARTLMTLLPFAVCGVLLTRPIWIAATAVLGGVCIALIYAAAYIDQSAEHRLRKHGFPQGTLERVLSERDRTSRTSRQRSYDAMYRGSAPDSES